MADTIRGDYPETYCSDCRQKGNVQFIHWGPLVPKNTRGAFCGDCWVRRQDDSNHGLSPRPLGTIGKNWKLCSGCVNLLPSKHSCQKNDCECHLCNYDPVVAQKKAEEDARKTRDLSRISRGWQKSPRSCTQCRHSIHDHVFGEGKCEQCPCQHYIDPEGFTADELDDLIK